MVWSYLNNLEQGQTERDRARVKEKASSCDDAFRSFRAIPAWRQSRFCSWRAASLQRFPSLRNRTLALVHIPHTATAAGGGSALRLFLNLRHKRFGGQHQRRDRAGVLQSGAHYLGRVEYARLDQVFVVGGQGVVAEVVVLRIVDLPQHDGAFFAGVLGDLAQRLYESTLHNVDADLLIALELQLVECGDAAGQGYTAARDNAFFDGRTGGVHGVFDASLLLFHLGLGRGTYLDDSHATDQLCQPLLQLLAVVVAGGLLDLAANFLYSAFDLGVLAFAFEHCGVVLVDCDFFGLAEIADLYILELGAQVFGDGLATG